MPPEEPSRPAGPAGPVDPADAPAEFRPGAVRVLAVAWWVLAGVLVVDLVANGTLTSVLLGGGVLALASAVVHALFWRPAVRVDRGGVELVNVWRTVRLPWSTLEDLDTRWALTLTAAGRRWSSWAAPASGRRIRPVRRSETPWAERDAEGIAGSRAPGSSAGEAAVLVGTRWERWRQAPGPVRAEGTGEPVVRWEPAALLPLAAAGLVLLAGVLTALG
ncbi:PH domain-containing protein [Aquipuribacter nitratireducens]|uniref:PH domain-containing protein n=1 Tax=Aquipuribacter nitratireducens TaxID=650104 RepID=A0ABW0GK20_9MICO